VSFHYQQTGDKIEPDSHDREYVRSFPSESGIKRSADRGCLREISIKPIGQARRSDSLASIRWTPQQSPTRSVFRYFSPAHFRNCGYQQSVFTEYHHHLHQCQSHYMQSQLRLGVPLLSSPVQITVLAAPRTNRVKTRNPYDRTNIPPNKAAITTRFAKMRGTRRQRCAAKI
jgi:hypothetical protein